MCLWWVFFSQGCCWVLFFIYFLSFFFSFFHGAMNVKDEASLSPGIRKITAVRCQTVPPTVVTPSRAVCQQSVYMSAKCGPVKTNGTHDNSVCTFTTRHPTLHRRRLRDIHCEGRQRMLICKCSRHHVLFFHSS